MLQPKKTKFRREQKNVMKGMAQRGNQLAFGSFGLKTLENCWITAQQIESARQAISRCMNREGQIWIRIFPVKPFTKKPLDTRMGKGKGDREIIIFNNKGLQKRCLRRVLARRGENIRTEPQIQLRPERGRQDD